MVIVKGDDDLMSAGYILFQAYFEETVTLSLVVEEFDFYTEDVSLVDDPITEYWSQQEGLEGTPFSPTARREYPIDVGEWKETGIDAQVSHQASAATVSFLKEGTGKAIIRVIVVDF